MLCKQTVLSNELSKPPKLTGLFVQSVDLVPEFRCYPVVEVISFVIARKHSNHGRTLHESGGVLGAQVNLY